MKKTRIYTEKSRKAVAFARLVSVALNVERYLKRSRKPVLSEVEGTIDETSSATDERNAKFALYG